MTPEKGDRAYLPALDLIRGFAAYSVLLFHLASWLTIPWLATNSWLAVDLFFCLSGFVLNLRYGAEPHRPAMRLRFATTRIIRLYPMIGLGVLISATFILAKTGGRTPNPGDGTLFRATALGMLNIPSPGSPSYLGGPQIFPLNGPQYSLFLEIVANFLWFYLLRRRTMICMAVAIASIAAIYVLGFGGDTDQTMWLGLPRVLASYFLGILVSELHLVLQRSRALDHIFWACVVIMCALFFWPHTATLEVGLVWTVVVSPLIVLAGARTRVPSALGRLAPLAGELSYPIYILQYPVFCWINGVTVTLMKRHSVSLEVVAMVVGLTIFSLLALALWDRPLRRRLSSAAASWFNRQRSYGAQTLG